MKGEIILDYFFSAINIFGGLALFLYGVRQSTESFRDNLGESSHDLMERFTSSGGRAFCFGVLLSAVTQSSTIATTFAVGLVDSGLLPFARSIIVMMGASLGGTFVSFLLNLNLFTFAPLAFALAYLTGNCCRRAAIKYICGFLQSISLIFLGMLILSAGTSQIFSDVGVRGSIENIVTRPWLIGICSFCCAGVLQSSSAIMALGISMASVGVLPSSSALPIALGAHIGSTTMVVMAGLSGRLSAKRLGIITFFYKLIGGVLFLAIMLPLHRVMDKFNITVADQLVYGQIIIACFNIAVFYPFPKLLEWLSIYLVTGNEGDDQPQYLDDEMLAVPMIAVELLSREVARLANMMEAYFQMLLEPSLRDEKLFEKLPEQIISLCKSCQEYCYKIKISGENSRLKARYSSVNYTVSILRAMTKPLCILLTKRLASSAIHMIMADWAGGRLWDEWRSTARRIMRASLRSFVIGEQGVIAYVKRLDAEFTSLSEQVVQKLQSQQSYDRDLSRSLRMISQMQGFLSITKMLADAERYMDAYAVTFSDEDSLKGGMETQCSVMIKM